MAKSQRRKLDLQLCYKMNLLNDKVDELSLISISSQDLSTNHQQLLERIESYSKANLLSSATSIMSLESIESKLEGLVTTPSNSPVRMGSSAQSPPTGDSEDTSRDFLAPSRHKAANMIDRASVKLSRTLLRKMSISEKGDMSDDRGLFLTEDIYPKKVASYISSCRSVTFYESQLALIKVRLRGEKGSTNFDADYRLDSNKLLAQSHQLEDHLTHLREINRLCRRQCIQSGYSLHEVDAALGQPMDHQRTQDVPTAKCHEDMFEIRRRTLDSGLLRDWTSTRDRINNWLLHSLRSDDSHARLHRSLLAEQELDGNEWAALVLEYWTSDEAATGLDLTRSLSIGATYSVSSDMESAVDYKTCDESFRDDPDEE